jgi:hypothetical protein
VRLRKKFRITYTEEVLVTIELEANDRASALIAAKAGGVRRRRSTVLRSHGHTIAQLDDLGVVVPPRASHPLDTPSRFR